MNTELPQFQNANVRLHTKIVWPPEYDNNSNYVPTFFGFSAWVVVQTRMWNNSNQCRDNSVTEVNASHRDRKRVKLVFY